MIGLLLLGVLVLLLSAAAALVIAGDAPERRADVATIVIAFAIADLSFFHAQILDAIRVVWHLVLS